MFVQKKRKVSQTEEMDASDVEICWIFTWNDAKDDFVVWGSSPERALRFLAFLLVERKLQFAAVESRNGEPPEKKSINSTRN